MKTTAPFTTPQETPPMTETPTTTQPSQIQAALETLLREWDGLRVPTGSSDKPENDCNCAGSYFDDDEPRCNCGDGCTCDSCHLYQVARMAACQGTAGCGLPTRLRVSAWSITPKYLKPDDGDTSPRDEHGHVQVGSQVYRAWSQSACGTVCARAIIDRHAHMSDRITFEVERYEYRPALAELPLPLAAALGRTGAAHRALEQLSVDVYRGGARASRLWWTSARRELAGAAAAMAQVPEPADEPEFSQWKIRVAVQGQDGQVVYTVEGHHRQGGGWLTLDRAVVPLTAEACGASEDDLVRAVQASFPGAEVTVERDPFPLPDVEHALIVVRGRAGAEQAAAQ
jgi:hypothetical protein